MRSSSYDRRRRVLATWCALVTVIWRPADASIVWSPAQKLRTADTRKLEFLTDEGTRMSVDVSPDGKTIVFDLLGTLYTMPLTGGHAQPLLAYGEHWDFCPRFAPDGSQLAFISNRSGWTDIWNLNLQTRQLRQLSDTNLWAAKAIPVHNPPRRCSPRWLADSSAVFNPDRDRVYVLSAWHRAGLDRLIKLFPSNGVNPSPQSLVILPDEKTAVAALSRVEESGRTSSDLFWVDLQEGKYKPLRQPTAQGMAFNPELSSSGRLLAYMNRNQLNDTELRVRDLVTGEDRHLVALRDSDAFVHEAASPPAYAFTPDERFIVIGFGGKLHKVSVLDGTDTIIPFEARVEREVRKLLRTDVRVAEGAVPIRAQRWPMLSNDGRLLVFSAAGSVWVRDLPDGEPRQVGPERRMNTMASLSPDKRQIAFVSFDYDIGGMRGAAVLMVHEIASGRSRALMEDDASYYFPAWSPDLTKLAVVRKQKDPAATQLGWIDLHGNTFHPVADGSHYLPGSGFNQTERGSYPRWIAWSADGNKLLFQSFAESNGENLPVKLEEVSLDASARRVVAEGATDVYAIVPAPDLRHAVVIGWDQNAYLVPLQDAPAQPVRISLEMNDIQRISTTGALFPSWVDGTRFRYGWMQSVFEYRVGQIEASEVARTELTLPRRQGRGLLAIRNARLITMAGAGAAGRVIERGTLLIEDRRILAAGDSASVEVPAGATVLDATGMTIMPGLVDTHLHDVQPRKLAFYNSDDSLGGLRSLAFGVTTAFEPGGGSVDDSAEDWRSLWETGRLLGPRWLFESYFENEYVRPGLRRDSVPELRARFRRKRDLGEGPCIKEYALADSEKSRRVAEAAAAEGACVVVHPDAGPLLDLARTAYGMALHHDRLPLPMHKDFTEFLLRSEVSWTPHIELLWQVDFPNMRFNTPLLLSKLDKIMDRNDRARFERFYAAENAFARSIRAARESKLDDFARTRQTAYAAMVGKLLDEGLHITVSGHEQMGPLRGEMLVWQEGGIQPARILRAATLSSAEQLGLQRDIGSLEPGKLADLLVLKANPLTDVLNSIRLKWTVIDGVVYDSTTFERVWPAETRH